MVNQLSKLGLIAAASSSPLSARIFEKLNAHSIANRILRKENYMIAIFNKDLLNLRIPFLFPKSNWGQRSYLTTIMEMNLWLCISSYVFDSNTGCVRKSFLRDSNRAHLANGLRKRFRFMALLNLLLSPFLVLFFLIYFFFRYAEVSVLILYWVYFEN